jgi:hypothetical protein
LRAPFRFVIIGSRTNRARQIAGPIDKHQCWKSKQSISL